MIRRVLPLALDVATECFVADSGDFLQ